MSDHSRHHTNLEEHKIRASLLLKSIRNDGGPQQLEAARRLGVTRWFAGMEPQAIVQNAREVKLKHCFEAVAREAGFDDWPGLKAWHEARPADEELFCPGGRSPMLKQWFRNYAEARVIHQETGGYLLPYRHQCFICGEDYIEFLGLDPLDPDWRAMGFDWVRPTDPDARNRLREKLLELRPVV